MKLDGDTYTLSTGRTFFANRGILGLSPTRGEYDDRLRASEGYDGGLHFEYEADEQLTAEERREIAAYMIDLWKQWGEQSCLSQ